MIVLDFVVFTFFANWSLGEKGRELPGRFLRSEEKSTKDGGRKDEAIGKVKAKLKQAASRPPSSQASREDTNQIDFKFWIARCNCQDTVEENGPCYEIRFRFLQIRRLINSLTMPLRGNYDERMAVPQKRRTHLEWQGREREGMEGIKREAVITL